jgi:3-oxoacyl-[acyl-carrier protein] reductase
MTDKRMFSLQDRVALVTGAAGGIGSAIVKNFLAQGAKVVMSGTNPEKLENFAKSLNSPDRLAFILCNLSDVGETNALFAAAEEKFGPIDILVNNAGKTKDKLVMMMKDEDFEEVININLNATFRLCKAAIKSMSKRQYGRIINITSIVGFTGNMGQANYTAAKAGIVGLSKTLAIEYATKGITVNCIAPGFIETPMTGVLNDKIKEAILAKIPMKKMGTPDDIAAACVFLASEEASYMTGQTLHANGGMAMY